jgi:hypothetical protein
MKIALTGHTRGLGLELKTVLESHGHEVIGFSKSSGYDIDDAQVRDDIISLLSDCEVFINNTYTPTGQTLLLRGVLSAWSKEQHKLVVNICSKVIYVNDAVQQILTPTRRLYYDAKKEQMDVTYPYNGLGGKPIFPNVMNVIPGRIDTELTKMFGGRKMNPNVLANTIVNMIELKDTLCIQEIVIDSPGHQLSR